MDFLSLFTGFGGMDAGLEAAGMKCVAQVEVNRYASEVVLPGNWPGVRRFGDVRGFEGVKADLVCGGPPCQSVSLAGSRQGELDQRWLWPEMLRIIRRVGPRWVLLENVRGILSADSGRVFGRILRDLSESGYDAEWQVLSAAAFGAPHLRERVFVVAYPSGAGPQERNWIFPEPEEVGEAEQSAAEASLWWSAEPSVVRVVHGVPDRVQRIQGLGNAVVPHVARWIGQRILRAAKELKTTQTGGAHVVQDTDA